jgi:hypothetical protein
MKKNKMETQENKEQEVVQEVVNEVVQEQELQEVKEEVVQEVSFNEDAFRETLNEASQYFKDLYGVSRNTLHADISKDITRLIMKVCQA